MLAGYDMLLPELVRQRDYKPKEELARDIQKIAVLRANKLGDYIFALPALEALRMTYPDAEIVLLGRQWHADFLRGRPGPVDRVVVVPPVRGIYGKQDLIEDPQELDRFFDAMTREHFDLAIQVHGDGRFSNPFVRRLGARLTVGSRMPEAQPLDLWIPYTYTQSEILRHLEIVSLVGVKAAILEPHLSVTERDLDEASPYLSLENPSVILHPGAESSRERWPVDKFAMIGDALAYAGVKVYVIGTEAEKALADEVVGRMSTRAVNLCGVLSLGGLAGLLSQSDVIISNNSDFLRLAWAVGAATVGIYWFGNLLTNGPLIRRRHRPAVSWRVTCPVCGLDCTRFKCEHSSSFVDDVTVMEVLSSTLDLLEMNEDG